MKREVSIFLDLARLLAAVAVFISHVSWQSHSGGLFWWLRGIGPDAVDVFFVLSGFVIAHVVATREVLARAFVVNRLARVLSVAVPALALTFLLDQAGMSVDPSRYTGFCCDAGASLAWQYFGNLLFLGNVWWRQVSPGSDIPYWSLGYEAWYYLAFGLFVFLPRGFGAVAAGVALLAAGPGIAVLFPLWLLGGVFYRLGARPVSPGWGAGLVGFGVAGLAMSLAFGGREGQIYDLFEFSLPRFHEYGLDYLNGGLFGCILLGVGGMVPVVSAALTRIERPVRWLAGATFALYLFHLPLIHFVTTVSPYSPLSWVTRGVVLVGVPLFVLLLAEFTERKKALWRNGLLRLFPPARVAGE